MTASSAPADLADSLFDGGEITPTRLGQVVIEKLTDAILAGRLKPGDPLPSEGRIAMAFGVSKQIAREAIRDLAALGVVQIQQGKVARVRSLDAEPLGRFFRFAVRGSREGLAEAVEMRQVLEPPIARLAALRRSEAGLAALRAVLARMRAAVTDIPVWMEADLDFHETIAELSGNRLLRLQMRGMRPVVRENMVLFNAHRSRDAAEHRATLDRHEAVVEAIAAGDGEGAFAAMVHHFDPANAAIHKVFPERKRETG